MVCQVNYLGGVAAIGFAALIALVNLILVPAGFPTPGADIDRVTQYFSGKRVALAISSAACPTAWTVAVMFGAATVVAVQARGSDQGTVWALGGLAGLILQTSAFVVVIGLRLALDRTRGAGAQTLWAVHEAVFTLNGAFLALAMIGLSLAGRSAGLVGPWHAAIGFISAALLFTSTTLSPLAIQRGSRLGLMGLAGWLVWVVWLVWYGVAFLTEANCVPQPSVQT
jgi:hypothetical protein